jgi:hypothetical protein
MKKTWRKNKKWKEARRRKRREKEMTVKIPPDRYDILMQSVEKEERKEIDTLT